LPLDDTTVDLFVIGGGVNGAGITRDYKLDLNQGSAGNGPPLVTVLGGKISTYRLLAEHAMRLLSPYFSKLGADWTATAPLPGGDMPNADFEYFFDGFQKNYPWLPAALALRLARAYGVCVGMLLANAKSLDDLGHDFGGGLYEREVEYLVRYEWAQTGEDILWRRSKLGLHCAAGVESAVDDWLGHGTAAAARAL